MSSIYFSSTLMWNAPLDEIFKIAYENGFDGIEFWAQHFVTRLYSVEDYINLSSLYPIRTAVHSFSWDLNLASLNDGLRESAVNETKKAIDLAYSMGGYEITIHPGKKTLEIEPEGYYDRLRNSLYEIYNYAKEQYIDVSLEIMEKKPKEFIVTKEDVKRLMEGLLDKFYYTLDIAHCDEENEIFDIMEHLQRISKIHISNRIGPKLHTPLRKGDFEFQRLIPLLEKYKVPMVVEGFDLGNEFKILKENIKYLKEIGGL